MSTPSDDRRHQVNLIMNSKGGVGKTQIALFLAQFYQAQERSLICFDADAMTASFSGFTALKVRRIEMMKQNRIDPRRFDEIMEACLTDNANVIVDTGASSYAEWAHYLIENDVHRSLIDAGRDVVVHAIVAGPGGTLLETLNDLNDLAAQLPEEVTLVVWLNEHFGPIEAEGKVFEQMEVYARHRARIHALIRLEARTPATFGTDFAAMNAQRLTFTEALASPAFQTMAKSRLMRVQREINGQLAAAL